MAIGTYSELKTAVADWLHRTDLTSVIPDFIAMAESRIRDEVRCRAMEQSDTGSLSAVTQALPTRFAEARRVLINDKPLLYLAPQVFAPLSESDTQNYTILGTNFVFQVTSGAYQIDYYQWFAPFSASGDTNWLLTNHPDIYLNAALAEAAVYLRDDPSQWALRYQASLARLRNAEAKFTGPLVVKTAVVV